MSVRSTGTCDMTGFAHAAKRLAKRQKTFVSVAQFLNRDDQLGRRLMGGTGWLTLGVGVYSAASLATSVLLARLLGIQQFGNYTILMTTLGVVLTLAGPSIGYTSSKYVSEYRYTNPEKAGRIIALTNLMALSFSLVFALVIVIGAGLISRNILKVPSIRVELMVASLAVLFTGVNGAQRGTLSGFHRFRDIALVNVVQGTLLVTLLFPLVRPYGIMGAVIAQSIAIAGSCIVGSFAIRREMRRLQIPRHNLPRREDFGIFGGFAFPSYLISIGSMVSSWTIGVLIVRSPGGSYQMGIFGVVTQIFLACMFLPTMISQPCVPILSEQLQQGEARRPAVRRLLSLMVSLSFLATLVLGLLLIVSGHFALGVFGSGLDRYYSLVVITILTAMFAAMLGPFNYYMTAKGDVWLAFGLSVIGIGANVGILFALRDSGAATGAVWGRLLSYLIVSPVLVYYALYTLRTDEKERHSDNNPASQTVVPG